jgi:hypothetical protein
MFECWILEKKKQQHAVIREEQQHAVIRLVSFLIISGTLSESYLIPVAARCQLFLSVADVREKNNAPLVYIF